MNLRVADIQASDKLWKSRGAELITEPIPKFGDWERLLVLVADVTKKDSDVLPLRVAGNRIRRTSPPSQVLD